ncbi:gliding motility-associated C-terminal domain-containing protein, partial [Flavobacteriales bacterium]|nr:gliding motility-associated C-terminal domain-containing protein [Flavobacteriales bacterium]
YSPGTALIGGVTTGNLLSIDPMISPLANNGGLTYTVAISICPISPAIDAALDVISPTLDQRAFSRIDVYGRTNIVDIGSFESLDSSFNLGGTILDTCDFNLGQATVFPIGGTAPYAYQWDVNAANQTTQTAINLSGGSYLVTVSDTNGCSKDTVFTIIGKINYFDTISDSICSGDSILFRGVYISSTGIYSNSLVSSLGCDSVIQLTLKVIPAWQDTTFLRDTICWNDSILLGGDYVNTSGVYYDSLVPSLNCDSLVQTTLYVIPAWQDTTFLRDTICWNDSILLGGDYVNTSGIYYDSLVPNLNCDSLVQTTLYVIPAWQDTTFLRDTICWNDSILLGGVYVNTSGFYYDSLVPNVNCDSLVQTTLYVLQPWQDTTFLQDTICYTDSVLLGGVYVNTSGVYYDSLVPIVNCDSLVQTTLYVLQPWQDTTFIRDTICYNDSILLGGSYVFISGIYYDSLVPMINCDSLVQTTLYVIPPLVFDLGDDTSLCSGFFKSITLNIKNASYLWQDGTSTNSISASSPGLYYVDVNVNGCVFRDSINLFLLPSPNVNLGRDTAICFQQESLVLDAENSGSTYLWSNSSTNQTLLITNDGTYNVLVTNSDGCTETDEIIIEEECPAKVFIPNAFSPNGDEINDLFYIQGENVGEIKWYIFNRWGEMIFEANSINESWDGTYMGEKVIQDIYTYMVYYKSIDGFEVKNVFGHVTIIR